MFSWWLDNKLNIFPDTKLWTEEECGSQREMVRRHYGDHESMEACRRLCEDTTEMECCAVSYVSTGSVTMCSLSTRIRDETTPFTTACDAKYQERLTPGV